MGSRRSDGRTTALRRPEAKGRSRVRAGSGPTGGGHGRGGRARGRPPTTPHPTHTARTERAESCKTPCARLRCNRACANDPEFVPRHPTVENPATAGDRTARSAPGVSAWGKVWNRVASWGKWDRTPLRTGVEGLLPLLHPGPPLSRDAHVLMDTSFTGSRLHPRRQEPAHGSRALSRALLDGGLVLAKDIEPVRRHLADRRLRRLPPRRAAGRAPAVPERGRKLMTFFSANSMPARARLRRPRARSQPSCSTTASCTTAR